MKNIHAIKKGFTLIELLVVISIIAILAAILFPVFSQAKQAAKKSVDLSNMKQLATGIYLYAGDYDDTFCQTSWEEATAAPSGTNEAATYPGTWNPQNPNGAYQIHWSYLIQPYIKNWGIFINPSDPNPVTVDAPCTSLSQVGTLDASGHMTCDWAAPVNSYITIYNALPAHDWLPVSQSRFPSPASQIVFTTHRNDGVQANQHKGVSGFFPSQPCNSWTIVPLPSGASTATPPSPAANTYSLFTAAAANAELSFTKTASSSNDLIAAATNTNLFKKYDILRTNFNIFGSGANYSFADGHAKYQTVAQILDPTDYKYGPTWYPNSAPWNASPCN